MHLSKINKRTGYCISLDIPNWLYYHSQNEYFYNDAILNVKNNITGRRNDCIWIQCPSQFVFFYIESGDLFNGFTVFAEIIIKKTEFYFS